MIPIVLITELPVLFGALGVVSSIYAFVRWRRPAYPVLGIVFCVPLLARLSNYLYVRQFESVQVNASTWTAPVIHADVMDIVVCGGIFAVLVLLMREDSSGDVMGEQGP